MNEHRQSPNRLILEQVARRIAPLLDDLVFVGGHVAELLVTAPGAVQIRPTDDVDVIVATATKVKYARVEETLRELGLRSDLSEGAPICRWLTPEGYAIDVMPVEGDVLGFSNRWYPLVMETATEYQLADDLMIQIPPAPVFLATKWEAFSDRGRGDALGSHDLEDIIVVVAGRPELIDEIHVASREARDWLAINAKQFLDDEMFEYALYGALPDARRLPELVPEVIKRFEAMSSSI